MMMRLFLLAMLSAALTPSTAAIAQVTVDDLTAQFKRLAEDSDRAGLLELYHWRGVDTVTRIKVEQEVDRLLKADLTKVEIKPFPKGMPIRFKRDGTPWRINLLPDRLVIVRMKEGGRSANIALPVGQSAAGTGYVVGITIPDVQVPASAEAPAPAQALTVSVVADKGVVAEIVCAYLTGANGSRKLVQYRGEGSFQKKIGQGATFDSCAAKKRAGIGDFEIRLIEPAGEIFRQSTAKIDHALVYRRK